MFDNDSFMIVCFILLDVVIRKPSTMRKVDVDMVSKDNGPSLAIHVLFLVFLKVTFFSN